jgi:hypothetical protein
LKLISDSVPGFDQLSVLATRLLECGKLLTSPDKSTYRQAQQEFQVIQTAIREELESICNNRDESKGLEKLKQSLALSSKYKTLCERIKGAENNSHLNLLVSEATKTSKSSSLTLINQIQNQSHVIFNDTHSLRN